MMHEADTMMSRGESWDDYRRWADLRVRALNHALARPPRGPRSLSRVLGQLARAACVRSRRSSDMVDLMLAVNAGYLRHGAGQCPARARVAGVGGGARCPEGKKLIPGVVTHHTNVVEHPELVAQRLTRLANVVGSENVLAGTDCGFAQGAFIQRVHPEIQWAKLAALAEGARLASRELWVRGGRGLNDAAVKRMTYPQGGERDHTGA